MLQEVQAGRAESRASMASGTPRHQHKLLPLLTDTQPVVPMLRFVVAASEATFVCFGLGLLALIVAVGLLVVASIGFAANEHGDSDDQQHRAIMLDSD